MTHADLMTELVRERFGPTRIKPRPTPPPADNDVTCARRRRELDEAFREMGEASA